MLFLKLTFNSLIVLLIISLLSACNSKTVIKPSERDVKPVLVQDKFIQTPYEGNCEGYSFSLQSDNQSINTSWPVRVLRHNAPVYNDANGNRKKTTLKFGEVLNALKFVNLAVCQMKL